MYGINEIRRANANAKAANEAAATSTFTVLRGGDLLLRHRGRAYVHPANPEWVDKVRGATPQVVAREVEALVAAE